MRVADRNRDVRTTVIPRRALPRAPARAWRRTSGSATVGPTSRSSSPSASRSWREAGAAVIAGFVSGLLFDLSTTAPIGADGVLSGPWLALRLAPACGERVAGDTGNIRRLCRHGLARGLHRLSHSHAPRGEDRLDHRRAPSFAPFPRPCSRSSPFLPFAYYFSRVRTLGVRPWGAGPSLGRRAQPPRALGVVHGPLAQSSSSCAWSLRSRSFVVFVLFGRSEGNFTFDIGGAAPRASGGSDSSAEKTASSRLVGLAVGRGGRVQRPARAPLVDAARLLRGLCRAGRAKPSERVLHPGAARAHPRQETVARSWATVRA